MRRVLAAMTVSQLEQMARVGYWRSPEEPDLPHPGDFVDASWDAAERRKVIEYLDHAYQIPMLKVRAGVTRPRGGRGMVGWGGRAAVGPAVSAARHVTSSPAGLI